MPSIANKPSTHPFKFIKIIIGILIHALASFSSAETPPQLWEIGPFIGRYQFDQAQSLKDGSVMGLRLGYPFKTHITLEGS